MNTKALHWLFFYFLVFADLSIQAQSFQVTPLSEKSGLLHAQINDIFEDASGLLWIASDQGLFRYNGRQFKLLDRGRYHKFVNYGPAESIAVADNKVTLLTSGTLDSLAFQALRSVGIVYDAVSSEAGASLWVLSETGVYCFKDRKLTRQTPEGFAEGYRQSLFIAEGEIIQILSPTGTLYRMKAGHTRFERRSLATTINAPTQYLRYNDSILFFIDSHKVFELHSQSVVTPSWVGLPEDIEITTIDTLSHQIMLGSQQHGLWLGKRTGENFTFTRVFDGNEPHRLIDLPFQQIDNIHCSLHDNVWLLERGRLWLLRKRPFKRLSQSVPMSSFEQLVFMGDGKIYIDSENGLFECQRTAETEFSGRPSGIRLERLQTAIAGHGKRLWIATVDGQILYYEDEKIVNVADLGDRGGIIFNIYADPAHDLWVMQAPTNEPIVGTLRITKDGKVKEYGEAEGFHSRMLIAKDSPYGVLYCAGIGERSYLYRYDDEHDRFVNLSAEMKFDHGENFEVHDLAISEDSTIWLASTAGLLRYKHGAIEKMYSDELYDNEAYAVTIGHEGSIWFSTDTKGVARYKDGEYAFFDLRAGLASNFLTYRSILCTANETIWLGTREGVYISIPEFRARQKTMKPIMLRVEDENQLQHPKASFPYHSTLYFDFVSLTYPTQTVQYAYRLEGYNNNRWTLLQKYDSLVLPKLKNGPYKLEVRARQVGGYEWSEPLVYRFVISRVWFAQEWAIVSYVLLTVLIVAWSTRIYYRRLRREKKILEFKVTQRTQEIARKNDAISAQMEELRQLNDEIATQRDNLLKQKEIIEQQNGQLAEAKLELEQKVADRTAELSLSNRELVEHNIQLEQFAFMMAHNLRGPVARLMGLASIFNASNPADPINKEIVSKIQGSSHDLDEIIRDIATILQVKKSVGAIYQTLNVSAMLQKVILSFKAEIESKKIAIVNTIDPSMAIYGIEAYVYSTFYNVLGNSIKYADVRKQPVIGITAKTSQEHLVIVFTDNGIGFDEVNQRDKLFKPFSRLNSAREGKGLGLYLIKIEMESMHGNVAIQSKIDEGTTVTLTFKTRAEV